MGGGSREIRVKIHSNGQKQQILDFNSCSDRSCTFLVNIFKYPLKDNLFAFDDYRYGSEDLIDRNEVLYPLESFAALVFATTVHKQDWPLRERVCACSVRHKSAIRCVQLRRPDDVRTHHQRAWTIFFNCSVTVYMYRTLPPSIAFTLAGGASIRASRLFTHTHKHDSLSEGGGI